MIEKYLVANPYIETVGADQYKEFLLQPFSPEMLANPNGKEPTGRRVVVPEDWIEADNKVLFNHWTCEKQPTFSIYKSKKNVITVYSTFYSINDFEYPKTAVNLDQFITDCQRCGVTLYWKEKVLDQFNDRFEWLMTPKQIKDYTNELYTKLNKDEEISY
jgi:hypothetical protein